MQQFGKQSRDCRDDYNQQYHGDLVQAVSKPPETADVGHLFSAIPNQLARCTYSDQAAATRCGMPWSGEFCIAGYKPQGCFDANG
jgi:hypothetical protein